MSQETKLEIVPYSSTQQLLLQLAKFCIANNLYFRDIDVENCKSYKADKLDALDDLDKKESCKTNVDQDIRIYNFTEPQLQDMNQNCKIKARSSVLKPKFKLYRGHVYLDACNNKDEKDDKDNGDNKKNHDSNHKLNNNNAIQTTGKIQLHAEQKPVLNWKFIMYSKTQTIVFERIK